MDDSSFPRRAPPVGTASAPVSRQNSQDFTSFADDLTSPQLSGKTAINTFENAQSSYNVADPHALFPVQDVTAGGGSAPASARQSVRMEDSPMVSRPGTAQSQNAAHLGPNPGQDLTPVRTVSNDGTTRTVDTTRTGASGVKRRDHHSHRHGGAHRSHTHTAPAFDPYVQTASYPFNAGRPVNHQSAKHSKPLFSLARPLPTSEQRALQKSYRDSVRDQAAGAPRQHHHHTEHPAVMGPGAVHHGGYPGQPYPYGYSTSRPTSVHAPNDNPELMALLQQILRQTNGASEEKQQKSREHSIATLGENNDEHAAPATGKEKSGDMEMIEKKTKTARAERRDSFGSDSGSCSSGSSSTSVEVFPSPWARARHAMREPFAEFIGTMILIWFGTGVNLQVFLSSNAAIVDGNRGIYLSISFGWAIGTALGVWVSGGISGGHINPAVTLALAVFRGFPYKKVPIYWLAQILGALTGAGINYGIYRRAISIYEGGPGIRTVTGPTNTASLFATYPLEYVSDANAFFQEFIDTAFLLIVVLAISDSNNASPPDGLNPLVLFFLILGIGATQGMQTAYCVNPARDLGPRLMTYFAGYGREVWNFRNQYWLWTPILATISGALFGALIYDTLIYTGSESPCNMKWSLPWNKKPREEFGPGSKNKLPAGQTEP